MTPATCGEMRAACEGDQMADQERTYKSRDGSLLHMSLCVRPDIAAPVGALAAYNSPPTTANCSALLDVIRYVGSTAELRHCLWTDSYLLSCGATQMLRHAETPDVASRLVVICFGCEVSWESCKQPTTAASTTMDAEYQACGAVA
jgi:hypothetical protein